MLGVYLSAAKDHYSSLADGVAKAKHSGHAELLSALKVMLWAWLDDSDDEVLS